MSLLHSELTQRRGYGEAPHNAILLKLAGTPGDDIGAWGEGAGEGLTGIAHKDYMVREMLDRTPAPGFLAADEARRNPQNSRTMLNLRFNGTRGSSADLPRHPDLFLGFTGNDPRGVENVPRFDRMREHMAARFPQLEVAMGDSVGHGGGALEPGGPVEAPHMEAERPMSGPERQRIRADSHRAVRGRLKVFSTSRDAHVAGAGVAGGHAARAGDARARAAQAEAAGEQWRPGAAELAGGQPAYLGHEWGADRGGDAREGFAGGGGGTGVGRGHDAQRGAALARSSIPTADLAVARYGQARGRRELPAGSVAAHAQRAADGQQQALGVERVGPGTGAHRGMAAAMSAAAQAGRAGAARDAAGADAAWAGQLAAAPGRAARAHGDVAQAFYQTAAGQEHGRQLLGRAAGAGAGALAARAAASGARQQLAWQGETDAVRAALARSMAQGAQRGAQRAETGDAARALRRVEADGARAVAPDHRGDGAASARGRGVTPAAHASAGGGFAGVRAAAAGGGGVGFQTAAAARELAVANYRGAPPVVGAAGAALLARAAAAGGMPLPGAPMARHAANRPARRKAPEYRGYTQVGGLAAGDGAHEDFVAGDGDERGFAGTGGMGLKALRYDRVAAPGDLGADALGGMPGA